MGVLRKGVSTSSWCCYGREFVVYSRTFWIVREGQGLHTERRYLEVPGVLHAPADLCPHWKPALVQFERTSTRSRSPCEVWLLARTQSAKRTAHAQAVAAVAPLVQTLQAAVAQAKALPAPLLRARGGPCHLRGERASEGTARFFCHWKCRGAAAHQQCSPNRSMSTALLATACRRHSTWVGSSAELFAAAAPHLPRPLQIAALELLFAPQLAVRPAQPTRAEPGPPDIETGGDAQSRLDQCRVHGSRAVAQSGTDSSSLGVVE